MAESPKNITISLAELYLLHDRVREKQPIDEDFAILVALVKNLIIGEERRINRLIAKGRKNGGTPDAGDVIDLEGTPIDPPQNDEPSPQPHPDKTPDPDPEKEDLSPTGEEKPTKPPQDTKPKRKGHGRGGRRIFYQCDPSLSPPPRWSARHLPPMPKRPPLSPSQYHQDPCHGVHGH